MPLINTNRHEVTLSLQDQDEQGVALLMPFSQQEFEANVENELNSGEKPFYKAIKADSLVAMTAVIKTYSTSTSTEACALFRKFESKGVVFPVGWKAFLKYLNEGISSGKGYTVDSNDALLYDGIEVLPIEEYYSRTMMIVDEEFQGKLTPTNLKNVQVTMKQRYHMNVSLLSNLFPKQTGSSKPSLSEMTQYENTFPRSSSVVLDNHGNQIAMPSYHPPPPPVVANNVTYNYIGNNCNINFGNAMSNSADIYRGYESDMAELKDGIENIQAGMSKQTKHLKEQSEHLRTLSTVKKIARSQSKLGNDSTGSTTPKNLSSALKNNQYKTPLQGGRKLFGISSSSDNFRHCLGVGVNSPNMSWLSPPITKYSPGSNLANITSPEYFKSRINRMDWTGLSEIAEFYPTNVIVHPTHSEVKEMLANDHPNFLSQQRILVLGEENDEVIVYNVAEFVSNREFTKVILGALSYTCKSTVFVVTMGSDNGEKHKVELSIRSKTLESRSPITELFYNSIVELIRPDSDCVGIVDPEYFNTEFKKLNLADSLRDGCLKDKYQIDGVDFHLKTPLSFPPGIIKCLNPSVIVDEHIKFVVDECGPMNLLDQKVLIDGDSIILAFSDAREYPEDHDSTLLHIGRIFGKPLGFLITADQCGRDDVTISFQAMAVDAATASKSLNLISSCLAATGPGIIHKVVIEAVDEAICSLPMSNATILSLVQQNHSTIEFWRFSISNDMQEALACSTALLIFVDCQLERGGYTVFVSNPRYTCAFTAPLRLEFKLYNCELGIGLPPYTLLKSAIENGRIASLGLFGADIESEKDIENIQMILNLGAKYDDQSTYFTIPISLKDVTLNVKVELEFSGIGRDLTIEGRRVVGVNTTHCQSKDNDRCFVIRQFFAGRLDAVDAFLFECQVTEPNTTSLVRAPQLHQHGSGILGTQGLGFDSVSGTSTLNSYASSRITSSGFSFQVGDNDGKSTTFKLGNTDQSNDIAPSIPVRSNTDKWEGCLFRTQQRDNEIIHCFDCSTPFSRRNGADCPACGWKGNMPPVFVPPLSKSRIFDSEIGFGSSLDISTSCLDILNISSGIETTGSSRFGFGSNDSPTVPTTAAFSMTNPSAQYCNPSSALSTTHATACVSVRPTTDVVMDSQLNKKDDNAVARNDNVSRSQLQANDFATYSKENQKVQVVEMSKPIATKLEDQYWLCQPINEDGTLSLTKRRLKAKYLKKERSES